MNTRKNTRISFETLDRRDLPAIALVGNTLMIVGTNLADNSQVRIDNRGTLNPADDLVVARLNAQVAAFPTSLVNRIEFHGLDGNDVFVNDTAIRSRVHGGDGNDYLVGGFAGDAMHGGRGSDVLRGRDGNDYLEGNDGKDWLYGEAGNDTLDGGYDGIADVMVGGSGADTFRIHRKKILWFYVTQNESTDFNPIQGDQRVFVNH